MTEEEHENFDEGGLVQSFEIDDGSLDGVNPVQAFTLGVEWHIVYQAILDESPVISCSIHAENADRILSMLKSNGYRVRLTPEKDGWMGLTAVTPELEER